MSSQPYTPTLRQCEWIVRALSLGVMALLVASWWETAVAGLATSLALAALLVERTWRRRALLREVDRAIGRAEEIPDALAGVVPGQRAYVAGLRGAREVVERASS